MKLFIIFFLFGLNSFTQEVAYCDEAISNDDTTSGSGNTKLQGSYNPEENASRNKSMTEDKVYLFNIPPGQEESKTFNLYAQAYTIPDNIVVHFDDREIGTLWYGGSSDCNQENDGLTEDACVRGPFIWNISEDSSSFESLDSQEASQLFIEHVPIHTLRGLVHVRIEVPPGICQVKIEMNTNPDKASYWEAMMRCPGLDCNPTGEIQVVNKCESKELSLNTQCQAFHQGEITWTGPNDFEDGNESTEVFTSGMYKASIQYANDCRLEIEEDVKINPIDVSFEIKENTCESSENGSIKANGLGGYPPYNYTWSSGETSQELADIVSDSYEVTVTDTLGCEITKDAYVEENFYSAVLNLDYSLESCSVLGQLSIYDANGEFVSESSVGHQVKEELFFNNEDFEVSVGGCNYVAEVERGDNFPADPVNIFYPNIFAPNSFGENSHFIIGVEREIPVKSFAVFDRWGSKMVEHTDFMLTSDKKLWDGTINGKPAASGVYAYIVEYADKCKEPVAGDVTVAR